MNRWRGEYGESEIEGRKEVEEVKGRMQEIERSIQGLEKNEDGDKLAVKIKENRKIMETLFEDMEEHRRQWGNKLSELQDETGEKFNMLWENIDQAIKQELKGKKETSDVRGILKFKEGRNQRNLREDNQGTEMNMDDKNKIIMLVDQSLMKELVPTSFKDEKGKNPKKFLGELEEFMNMKGIPEDWRILWFKKCIEGKVLLWYEVIGKKAENFEDLKVRFLNRYWNEDRQAEVIRMLYSPTEFENSNLSKEKYLLRASEENRYLDYPLPDKTLINTISRQFGADMVKHVMISRIETVEEFVQMLNSWEAIEEDIDLRNKG